MGDCMNFPDTVDEYMEQYKMTDTKQVYSNGIEYVPIFRMEQWFEHEKAQQSRGDTTSDLISKTETIERLRGVIEITVPITDHDGGFIDGIESSISTVSTMPTAQPRKGKWKRRLVDNGFNADWVCSECGYRDKTDFVSFNFCPNCGADMRGKKDE